MELGHLRYFYEVAKAGSFTAASRVLRVSQPSLSKAVALLEARESVRLLERSKSGVRLTTLGERVFAECESIFRNVEEVERLCHGTQAQCQGPLRIGASDHIANYFLVKPVCEIVAQFPGVYPSVFVGSPHEIIHRLLQREIEFGLFFTKVKTPQISYQPLLSIPMAIVYSPNSQFADTHRLPKNKMRSFPNRYIASIRSDFKQTPAQDILSDLKNPPALHFESNSQEMQKRLALNGAGLAILARFMVEKEIANGSLVELNHGKAPSMELHLAKRSSHDLSLNAKTFIQLLKKQNSWRK